MRPREPRIVEAQPGQSNAAISEALAAAFDGVTPDDLALADPAVAKRAYLALMRSIAIQEADAAAQVGWSARTIRQWAHDDPEFGRARAAAQTAQRRIRVGLVEDSLFVRILRGQASAACEIFWLKANGGPRWKYADRQVIDDRRTLPRAFDGELSAISDEELAVIAARVEVPRGEAEPPPRSGGVSS